MNKNSDAPALDRITGSRAVQAVARSIYGVAADPDDPEHGSVFVKMKNNLVQRVMPGFKFRIKGMILATGITAPYIRWGGEDRRSMDELLGGKSQQTKLEAAADFLKELLHEGPMPTTEIEEVTKDAGLSWRTVQRAQGTLGIVPKPKGKRWYWKLPEQE